MIREVLLLGNPSLRRPADPIPGNEAGAAHAAAADLRETLLDLRRRFGFGRGLAAPQIGLPLRMVSLIWPDDRTLINPRVVAAEGEQWVWDDCFSIPGLMLRVRRPRAVKVAYFDLRGNQAELEAEGAAAELVQHELDHLDGILVLDRVESIADIMARGEWQRQFRTV